MAIRFAESAKAAVTAKRDGGPRLTEKEVQEIAVEGVTTAEPVALDGGRGQAGVDRPVLGGRDPEPCPDDVAKKRRRGRPVAKKPWLSQVPPVSRQTWWRRMKGQIVE